MSRLNSAFLILLSALWNLLLFAFYILGFFFVLALTSAQQLGLRLYQGGLLVFRYLDKVLALTIKGVATVFQTFAFVPVVGGGLSSIGSWLDTLGQGARALIPFLAVLLSVLLVAGITLVGLAVTENQNEIMVGFDQAWCSSRDGFGVVLDIINKVLEFYDRFLSHTINIVTWADPTLFTPTIRLTFALISIPQTINDVVIFAALEDYERRISTGAFAFEGIGYVINIFTTIPFNNDNCYALSGEPKGGVCLETQNPCGDDGDCKFCLGGTEENKQCTFNIACAGGGVCSAGTCGGTCAETRSPCDNNDKCNFCLGGTEENKACTFNIDCAGGGVCSAAGTCGLLPVIPLTAPLTCQFTESVANANCNLDPASCPALLDGRCFSGSAINQNCTLDIQCANICSGGEAPGASCAAETALTDCPGGICNIGQCSVEHMCATDRFVCWLQRLINQLSEAVCDLVLEFLEGIPFFQNILNFINFTVPQFFCELIQFFADGLQIGISILVDILNDIIVAVNNTFCFAEKAACFPICAGCGGFPTFSCPGVSGCTDSLIFPICPGACTIIEGPLGFTVPPPSIMFPDGACDALSNDPGGNCDPTAGPSECGLGTCKIGSCNSGENRGFGCTIATSVVDCGAGIVCNENKCERDSELEHEGCVDDDDCNACVGGDDASDLPM